MKQSLALILCAYFLLFSSNLWATSDEPITALPKSVPHDADKAKLGKKLFHDKRLSKDDTISCASCHGLDTAGVDLKRVSPGIDGKLGERNSPTVYNSVFNFKQFWDGRANDLKAQAAMPVTNPVEMGMSSWSDVISKLKNDNAYKQEFQQVFGESITEDNIQVAIAEYEKTLISHSSPFDKYLQGDGSAISETAKQGYDLFKTFGCVSCHQGKNVGGNMYQKFGALKDINLREHNDDDLGRYEITKNEWDKRVFKVPSLRLAALTPPYFHDGSVATLEEAVDIMIEFQLGRRVSNEDRDKIIEFLKTLPGVMHKEG